MATYLENLTTRRNAVAAELAAITSTSAGGKPDAGKSGIGHVAYRSSLLQELEQLDKLIDKASVNEGGDDGTIADVLFIAET